tara:strand:- start:63 stop:1058 length:996 start_codon:yes stop_codon:yes gene_type:complete
METTMKTIEEIILISRPNLKPNSVKQYAIHIKKLMRLFETADYSFLENPDDVMSKLEDRHYTSKRNTLNAIIVFLTGEDSSDTGEAIKTYQKIRDELNAQYNEEQLSGKISEKQKDNFCELSEIQGMVDEMAKHIQERDIRGRALKTGLSQKDRELLIVWVIFNFLIVIPTRNDMAGQKLITRRMYNKLTIEDKENTNYIIREKSGMTGIYNEYKTSKKYGERQVEIPKPLEKILNVYIRLTQKKAGDVLFTSQNGSPLSRNGISQMLLRNSKAYLNGKCVSTTIMRKVVASHHFGGEFAEKKKEQLDMANKMGNSPGVMDLVYVKQNIQD